MCQETINCPVCRSDQQSLYLQTYDRFDSEREATYNIVKCNNCGFIFLNPRPQLETLDQFYNVKGYDPFLSTDEKSSLRDKFYMALRNWNLNVKYNQIKQYKKESGKILDIGCATGEFLEKFQRYYWKCTGVEVADTARQVAKTRNIKVFSSVHEVPDHEKFDLITLWHVLEHVHDLEETVKKIKTLLKPDGLLVIAVPNIESYDASQYNKDWVALDTPRHLYHFTEQSMARLFANNGMTIQHKHKLLLDILYNNLLSKQLAGTNSFVFIKNILISLLKSYLGPVKNASSIIYYISKEQ